MILLDNSFVYLNSSGDVSVSANTRTETSCNIDLLKFPFDTQNCTIYFGLQSLNEYYISSSIYYQPDNDNTGGIDYFSAKTEWLDLKMAFYIQRDLKQGFTFTVLVFTLQMRRNPTFYVLYLLIPSILMAFVSVLVFLLPPESGERIGLSITGVLSYIVFLLTVSEMTPRGGSGSSVLGRTSNRTIQPFNSNS